MQKFLTVILLFTMITTLCLGAWLGHIDKTEGSPWSRCMADIFLSIFRVIFGGIILFGAILNSKKIAQRLQHIIYADFVRAGCGILFGLFAIIFGIYLLLSRIFYTALCTNLLN
jgi:hypothetical protein